MGSLQKCVSCLSRLAKSNCEQTRCKSCCYKSINICPLHLKEREEEVALLKHHHGIVDAPLQNRKTVPKGSFAESNITCEFSPSSSSPYFHSAHFLQRMCMHISSYGYITLHIVTIVFKTVLINISTSFHMSIQTLGTP